MSDLLVRVTGLIQSDSAVEVNKVTGTKVKALVYILQGSASRRVRNKFRLRRKMKDC